MKSIRFLPYDTDFFEYVKNTSRELVIYGAGSFSPRIYPYLPKVSYVCDKEPNKKSFCDGIDVISLEDLEHIGGRYIVLICVKSKSVREEIKRDLLRSTLDAEVLDIYESISFPVYKEIVRDGTIRELHRVRLVNYDTEGWILSKFAHRLRDNLISMGIDADIDNHVDPDADINHHIQFGYEPIAAYRDTIMISHVNSRNRLEMVKHELEKAEMGICMSRETMDYLTLWGVPRHKLCYINPAHDGVIKPKKYVLGITHRCYDNVDNRKRTSALLDICKCISPNYFCFKIMGSGWDGIISEMRNQGFTVDYFPDFDYGDYNELIQSLDYYLFFGFDEGSMGILDAIAAGVKTIVTPQGFHLDIKNGITHACSTINDFVDVLFELEQEKKLRIKSVSEWTWENYTRKHVEVWNYILGNTEKIYDNMHMYQDGIFSVLRLDS